MRFLLGWRRVLSAWALLLILILVGFGAVSAARTLHVAQAGPDLQGVRIPQFHARPGSRSVGTPQFDPFDLGPPAFEKSGSSDEADFDAEAHFPKWR